MNNYKEVVHRHFRQETAVQRDFSAIVAQSIQSVAKAEARRATRLFYAFSALFLGSTTLFGWGVVTLVRDIATSGFGQLFGMLFSDFGVIKQFWADFIISIAENMPVMSISIVLAAALASLVSLRAAILTRFIFIKEQKVYGKN